MAKKLSDMDDDFLLEDEEEESEGLEKKKINLKGIIITVLLIGIVTCVAIFCIKTVFKDFKLGGSDKASTKHVDLKTVFEVKEGSYPLIIDGALSEYRAYEMDGQLYLNRRIVASEIDCRFYYDELNDRVLYTTEDTTYTFAPDSKEYVDSEGNKTSLSYAPIKENANGIYIALDFINFKRTMFTYSVYEEPKRIDLWTYEMEQQFDNYKIKSSTALRNGDSIKNDILADIKKDEYLTVLEDSEDEYVKVIYHGIEGYVKKKCVEKDSSKEGLFVINPEFKRTRMNDKVSLGWVQVTTAAANSTVLDYAKAASGVNVISPTWYQVENTSGDLVTFVDDDIVANLHRMGYKVWPLVSDFVIDVNSKELLSKADSRANIINKLMADAKKYGYEGINIDFEHVKEESSEDFLQFIRELSVECRKAGIILSADTYVPMSHTEFYNRGEQGKVIDYVIVMAYDEHWAGAPESGSVASLPFVENGIKNTILQVKDPSKVIVALPFYTRIWAEDSTSGTVKITSKAYGIKSVMDTINANTTEKVWLSEEAQYYAQYKVGDVLYKCWIEDSASMEEKLRVAKNNNLAGYAFWRLGLENAEIYDVINKYR